MGQASRQLSSKTGMWNVRERDQGTVRASLAFSHTPGTLRKQVLPQHHADGGEHCQRPQRLLFQGSSTELWLAWSSWGWRP